MGFLITKLISANVMNHSVIVQRTGLVGPQLELGWRSLTRQAGRDEVPQIFEGLWGGFEIS